jgi:hypothetical protein
VTVSTPESGLENRISVLLKPKMFFRSQRIAESVRRVKRVVEEGTGGV